MMAGRMDGPRRGTTRREARPTGHAAATILAWALGAPIALVSIVGTLAVATAGDISTTSTVAPMAAVTSVLVGAILVSRLPRHPIGWLLWLSGILFALTRITQGVADRGLTSDPGSIPGAIWFAWVNAWLGIPGFLLLGALLPLLYPTGRPPSPRWRAVEGAVIVETIALAAVTAVTPFSPSTYPPGVENPLELGGTAGQALAALLVVLNLALFLLFALALASLGVRYRRAVGIERLQLRWFAFVAAIAILALLVAGILKDSSGDVLAVVDWFGWLIGLTGLALLPIAIGIAILRYRLYEIDRIISRTIGWLAISGIIGAVFAIAIVGLQALLAPVTENNTIAVAGSTLLAASLFQPLRRRVQRAVDRRFNRARLDAARTSDAFAERIRSEVDLGTLRASLAATANEAMRPDGVAVWLRGAQG
jgi:hypothetical protein